METDLNRFRGCLLGLAVGDAVGATVGFQARGSFPLVTDEVAILQAANLGNDADTTAAICGRILWGVRNARQMAT